MQDGIALPCGWAFDPPVEARVLARLLRLGAGDLALFHEDASWERVAHEDFVSASRSAVRLTLAKYGDG